MAVGVGVEAGIDDGRRDRGGVRRDGVNARMDARGAGALGYGGDLGRSRSEQPSASSRWRGGSSACSRSGHKGAE